MRGYRSELHSLRKRVRELERTLDEEQAEVNLGPRAKSPAARGGYRLGRWVARKLSWFGSEKDVESAGEELRRLREREKAILEELGELEEVAAPEVAPTSGEEAPTSGAPAPKRKFEERTASAGFRAGRAVRAFFVKTFGSGEG